MRTESQNHLLAILAIVIALLLGVTCLGQACHGPVCGAEPRPLQTSPQLHSPVAQAPTSISRSGVARIRHTTPTGVSYGSGTLIAHRAGASWFVTCAHLFDDGQGRTEVLVTSQGALRAEVAVVDRANDLALLRTKACSAKVAVISTVRPTGWMTACGYGSTGEMRCVRGPVVGFATPRGAQAPSLRLRGAVRQGDSGGPVFNALGQLVAVVWGTRDGETYATFGEPLRRLLCRLPRRESRLAPVKPAPPTPSPNEVIPKNPASPDRLPAIPIESPVTPPWRIALGEISSTGLLMAGLGVGGPIGAAMLIGRYLLTHRVSRAQTLRTRPIAVDSPPPPQQVVPETHYVSYERDAFAQAHQWACEQLARKFPGSVELLTSLDSLIKQHLAGDKSN